MLALMCPSLLHRSTMPRGSSMDPHQDAVIIQLDDPPPRGMTLIAVIVMLAIVVLVAAPFALNSRIGPEEVEASRTPIAAVNSQVCQPAVNLPSMFDPVTHFALPSWMRLCDWFTEPGQPPINRPPHT